MELTNPKDLQVALALAGLKPNKDLGQHFLIDAEALDKIIATANISKSDTVLEIGPGVGTLTAELAKRASRVIAVERDSRFAGILRKQNPSVTVIEQDFLNYKLPQSKSYKVVANLPYYITSRIVQILLTAKNQPTSITILVQKEVAWRIIAQPGQMSVLAFSVAYYGQAKLVDIVPAASFWPAPQVDSAILHINVFPKPIFDADAKLLFKLVKAGFGERRKMLRNSLSGGLLLDIDTVAEWLIKSGIDSKARAQELSMGQWQALYSQAIDMQIL